MYNNNLKHKNFKKNNKKYGIKGKKTEKLLKV